MCVFFALRFVLYFSFVSRETQPSGFEWNSIISSFIMVAMSRLLRAEKPIFECRDDQRPSLKLLWKFAQLFPTYLLLSFSQLCTLVILYAHQNNRTFELIAIQISIPQIILLLCYKLDNVERYARLALPTYYMVVNTVFLALSIVQVSRGDCSIFCRDRSEADIQKMTPTVEILSPLALASGWIGVGLLYFQACKDFKKMSTELGAVFL